MPVSARDLANNKHKVGKHLFDDIILPHADRVAASNQVFDDVRIDIPHCPEHRHAVGVFPVVLVGE